MSLRLTIKIHDSVESPHPLPTTSYQRNNLGESLAFSGSKFLRCKIEVRTLPSPGRQTWTSQFFRVGPRWNCVSTVTSLKAKNFISYDWIQPCFHTPRLHGADGLPYPTVAFSLQYRDSLLLDSNIIVIHLKLGPSPENSARGFCCPCPSPWMHKLLGGTGRARLLGISLLPACCLCFSFPFWRRQPWGHILHQ